MSDQQLSHHGHEDEEEYDKECDVPHPKQPSEENPKNPSDHLASLNADLIKTSTSMTDNINRPGDAYTEVNYARAGTYEISENKIGAYAEAGLGRARAEYKVFQAEAKGPNASAGAEIGWKGAGAMARAEIASASFKAGPVGARLGLGVDTGASIGKNGVEVKVLGTGFSIGPRTNLAVLGAEVEVEVPCAIM